MKDDTTTQAVTKPTGILRTGLCAAIILCGILSALALDSFVRRFSEKASNPHVAN